MAHVKQEEERVASMEFFNLSFKGILAIITFVVLIQKLAEQQTLFHLYMILFKIYSLPKFLIK